MFWVYCFFKLKIGYLGRREREGEREERFSSDLIKFWNVKHSISAIGSFFIKINWQTIERDEEKDEPKKTREGTSSLISFFLCVKWSLNHCHVLIHFYKEESKKSHTCKLMLNVFIDFDYVYTRYVQYSSNIQTSTWQIYARTNTFTNVNNFREVSKTVECRFSYTYILWSFINPHQNPFVKHKNYNVIAYWWSLFTLSRFFYHKHMRKKKIFWYQPCWSSCMCLIVFLHWPRNKKSVKYPQEKRETITMCYHEERLT